VILSGIGEEFVWRVIMEEDLAKQWERFNLLDVETKEVEASDATMEPLVSRGTACAVGKLLADRTVGKEVLKTPMVRAWQPTGWVSFKTLGPNLFLIELTRILEGRPWKFDSDLFSVADFDGRTLPSGLEFEKAAFWVRMYGMPLACMSREMGQRIGASMGKVEEVDVDEVGVGWGEFLWVRIVLDLTKPLSRGQFLKLRDRTIWITFCYERIPRFCFKCGVIRHGGRGCVNPGGRKLQENENLQEFGPWLRVSPSNRFGGGGGGGRGRFNESKKEYAQPSNSATSGFQNKGASKLWEWGGGGSAETGGGSSDTSPVTTSDRNGKKVRINEGDQLGEICGKYKSREEGETNDGKICHTQENGILGEQIRNEGGVIEKEMRESQCSGKVMKKKRSAGIKILGDPLLSSSIKEGETSKLANKEKISSTNGKSIYVGQWDHIKEKMTWQAVEKGAEVGGNFNIDCSSNHVEDMYPKVTPAKGLKNNRSHLVSSGSKTGPGMGKNSQAGGLTPKDQREITGVNLKVKGLAGKRKTQGENNDSDRDWGKRTKANMDVQEDCSSEEAVAVK
jgi:hypothetical protein